MPPFVALRAGLLDEVVTEETRLLQRAFEMADPQVAITDSVRRGFGG